MTSSARTQPHVEQPTDYDAVLLLSFGGPEGQDDVIPFLRNVTRGRGIPDERLEEVATHYRHFGGVSPINAQNRALREALEAELRRRGSRLPVLWGNRNWAPFADDVLREAADAGMGRVLAVTTSAYSSYSSCRQYREDLARAGSAAGGRIELDKVRQYFDHPGFVRPFVETVAAALRDLVHDDASLDPATDIELLFATHSIPLGDAEASGPPARDFGGGGAYAAQHRAIAGLVAGEAAREFAAQTGRDAVTPPWQLVYQSRSGPASQPWLEPDVNDAISALPGVGRRAVVVVPIGFVSDHMEVMWDLDEEAAETARDAGLAFIRTPTPGTHPAFVAGLADLVEERLSGVPASERARTTPLGPWYDVCRPGCCAKAGRPFLPAAAGIEP
ncbi:ferrochelatase [Zafaria sp. Z1313]|uniref:ferrochelatase n=1 Tax=unclassified Zafaria TaxID=2828765 RepID=UPI002E781973|nr:ferrochelatase [Zafaria sp. J156]MEE1620938.1 ferrochelatase [Zafaria sp. J156]